MQFLPGKARQDQKRAGVDVVDPERLAVQGIQVSDIGRGQARVLLHHQPSGRVMLLTADQWLRRIASDRAQIGDVSDRQATAVIGNDGGRAQMDATGHFA